MSFTSEESGDTRSVSKHDRGRKNTGGHKNRPDLRNHLNQSRGKGDQTNPDLRNHLNGRRDPSRRREPGITINDYQFQAPPKDPVQERIDQLEKAFRLLKNERGSGRYEDSDEELEPFAPNISNTQFPQGFRIPHVPTFEGKTDPCSHLSTFNTIMRASNVGYELRCMLFPTSLTGPAKSWFEKYKRHSITSWEQLSKDFKKQFRAMVGVRPEASTLTNVRQQPGKH